MPVASPLVRFQGIRKSYDGIVPVVRELDLDIAQGEFLTLLGPSGSGKTTTLMMLAGFEQPDAGEILLDGRSIARMPPHRRDIGVVFQSFALFPHMTVAENVAFPLRVRRVGRADRRARVARALEMVHLDGLSGRKPAQLSGGQQQRVALARALVFEPRLVLLDEPLGALDKQLREEMQAEIHRLHQQLGVTMLYVTHDQGEALTLSDRIAVFADGTILQLGSPQSIYEQPANAFVARFVGENNCLPGTVLDVEDGMARVRLRCGPVVEALMADAVGGGTACVVSVRPERVAVAAIEAAEMGESAIPARLIELRYLGDHLRLRMAVGEPGREAAEITVKRPAGAPIAGLAPGAPAAIAWEAHHARAFLPERPV